MIIARIGWAPNHIALHAIIRSSDSWKGRKLYLVLVSFRSQAYPMYSDVLSCDMDWSEPLQVAVGHIDSFVSGV